MTAALPSQRENSSKALVFKEEVSLVSWITTPFMGFYFLICSLHGGGAVEKKEIQIWRGKCHLAPTSILKTTKYPDVVDGNPTINRIPMTSRVPRHLVRNGLRRKFGNRVEPIPPCSKN
jgi:hypothetical protein